MYSFHLQVCVSSPFAPHLAANLPGFWFLRQEEYDQEAVVQLHELNTLNTQDLPGLFEVVQEAREWLQKALDVGIIRACVCYDPATYRPRSDGILFNREVVPPVQVLFFLCAGDLTFYPMDAPNRRE